MRMLWALGLALVCGASLRAQEIPASSSADSLYFAGRVADALVQYESALAARPGSFDVLCKASRAALVLGILSEQHEEAQTAMYLRAESFARRAIATDSLRADGHYWLAAAMGRRALHAGIKTAPGLARAVDASARRALAIDSMHAGAHDVLGKLNSEVRNLSAVVRFIAGRMLGVSIARETSWEAAERHLVRAIQIDSTVILYRADLAQLYLRTGRRKEAETVVARLLAMPRVHPTDSLFQQEAKDRLARR
jgi:tetratricopeptide (TPR) repeat protein